MSLDRGWIETHAAHLTPEQRNAVTLWWLAQSKARAARLAWAAKHPRIRHTPHLWCSWCRARLPFNLAQVEAKRKANQSPYLCCSNSCSRSVVHREAKRRKGLPAEEWAPFVEPCA